MAHWKRTAAAAGLVCAIGAQPGWAEVTASQVWDDWKSYMQGFGYTITGTEARSGDTLLVTGITMAIEIPEGGGSVSVGIPELSFTDNGDGTVDIGVPAVLPMSVSGVADTGEAFDGTVNYTTTGFSMTASGDPEDLTYTYSAAAMAMTLASLTVDGEDASDFVDVTVEMAGVLGRSAMAVGEMRAYDQTLRADGVTYTMRVTDPEAGGNALFTGTYSDLMFEGVGEMPLVIDPQSMASGMLEGFALESAFSHQGSRVEFNVVDEGQTVTGAFSSAAGSLAVAFGAESLAYGVSSTGLSVNMAGGDLPLPVELSISELGFDLLMPVGSSEEEQDFALGITLIDFATADMLWSMFDPAGVLPRDPATVVLDIAGKGRLNVDIMNPEAMAAFTGDMPGELNSLTLNDLVVSVAGAELTGTGDFVFDNSDLQTFDGFPRPVGSVKLNLNGANGLIDKLIQMGLLPQEQAMGARMMMGMLAVPVGDDQLQSTIEINEQGHVLANGQRLQ